MKSAPSMSRRWRSSRIRSASPTAWSRSTARSIAPKASAAAACRSSEQGADYLRRDHEPERSRELVKALIAADRHVVYGEIESVHGHDAFLMTDPPYVDLMRTYLARVAEEVNA